MITSLTNEKIKNLVKLNQKKYRDEENLFIVEGEHLVLEAQKQGIVEEIITIDSNISGTLVSNEVMKKICNQSSIVKMIAVCKKKIKENIGNKVIILDSVQDPLNVGTIIRSAVAFGFDTIISFNSADVFSSKVLRGTQGAIFKINYLEKDIWESFDILKGYRIYGTALKDATPLKQIEKCDKMAIIFGNEGNGVNEEILKKTDKNIFIEIENMESLNVAVAASIIMYEMGDK